MTKPTAETVTPTVFRVRWPSIAMIPCVSDLLDRADALEEALRLFVDDEDCRFDHHGYCQEHGITKPCQNAVARAALGEDPS